MTSAIFVGDALGLDFLNSIATPLDTPVDWIKDGEGLLDWVGQARLAPPEALETMREQALPGELDRVADQARRLREWFRGFVGEHKGRPLAAQDLAQLEPLNRLLERDEIFARIAPILADKDLPGSNEIPLQLQTTRKWRTPEALLLPIGEALARFVCSEDFSHVKACEGPACTLLFVDHTRGHRRRWCSMAQCGNRAKQAAHRHRVKAHHD
ncbi:CGNR zinc finger domain-containing protein [Mesorhizobium erdmanii]|uniref:CGNR zinc finger domain-containing protein n=1 Tax=Mesorhizobium erdmanii TaxID=1777866 RepID=UPI0004098B7F|nr:CGNR zinc finger domain-containing protein [Mesorhizobium erdmanii]